MIGTYRNKLEQAKGKLASLESNHKKTAKELEKTRETIEHAEEALSFIQRVAQATQGQVKVHIEDIITMALETILDDPYTFELDFVLRRNKTECDIYFVRDGNKVHPIDESGGGAVDIASFASRIALWSLDSTDNVLIFDEPFRFVSKEYQLKVGELVKQLSTKLGLQIIMVSHNSNFIQQADNVIEVYNEHGVSKIRDVKEIA
jgi:DNA repair exonuclease SbcCD ATPase subunit